MNLQGHPSICVFTFPYALKLSTNLTSYYSHSTFCYCIILCVETHRVQDKLMSLYSQPLHWPCHPPSGWLTFVLSHTYFPTLFTSVMNKIKYTPHSYTWLMNIPNLCKKVLLISGSHHLLTISNLLSSLAFTLQPLLHIINWIFHLVDFFLPFMASLTAIPCDLIRKASIQFDLLNKGKNIWHWKTNTWGH